MSRLQIGDIVGGKYKILSLIGTGGMAHVYKALNIQTGKIVALKVLKEEYAQDAEFLRRFRSEAQAVLHLSHDNIVRSMDVGVSGDDNYIVLEYAEGQTLKKLIQQEAPFPERQAIQYAMQLCDALGHAHDRGLIHRDVKPQNIIVNAKGKLKVADFGIARFANASTMTYQGANVLGSVHYISPEQARGGSADQRSDIYSLGVVLYEMLTGEVPFDAPNTVSVAVMHIQNDIPGPREINSQVSPALNSVLIKATRRDPEQRYASMREFKKDLVRALRDPERVIAQPEQGEDTLQEGEQRQEHHEDHGRLPRMRRPSALLGLMLAVALALGTMTVVFMIGKGFNAQNRQQSETRHVPTLTGKTEAEAQTRGKNMGFEVIVRSRLASEEIPKGTVMNQTPASGAAAKEGDTIYIDVSAGGAAMEMVELTGLPQSEAEEDILQLRLVLTGVNYEYSEQMEAGRVLRHYPEAGAEVEKGDGVELWISGKPEEREYVPALRGKTLKEAAQAITQQGFGRLLARIGEETQELPAGTVQQQSPMAGNAELPGTTIEVWITPFSSAPYGADDAVNLEIAENDTQVMITLKEGVEELVIYEQTHNQGADVVPLSIQAPEEGERELIVYINGQEVGRKTIKLTLRDQ